MCVDALAALALLGGQLLLRLGGLGRGLLGDRLVRGGLGLLGGASSATGSSAAGSSATGSSAGASARLVGDGRLGGRLLGVS